MAKIIGSHTIKCACGNTLTKRNIRNSGMAVCRCGSNFPAEEFDDFEPVEKATGYCWHKWDADVMCYVTCDAKDTHGVYGLVR